MLGAIASSEQPTMNLWVQSFDPTIKNFRRARVLCHFGHC